MSGTVRVLNLISVSPGDLARLRAVSPQLEVIQGDERELDGLDDPVAEVIFAHSAPPPQGTPRLRWLQLSSAGVNHLSGSDVWLRDIMLTNARGVYAVPMAEYVLAAVLSASQRVDKRKELQARHEWPVDYAPYECYGVRGKTIVIIGYGTVGRETARLATALGMRVLAVKAHPETLVDASFREPDTGDPEGRLPERVTGLDQLGELARQADYVVITLPLTPATDGLIDEHLLRQLPQHAWLVNVGRGRVIDEGALIDCLSHQRIAGAWLDVFATEPLPPESPLWTLPNVTITPHISGGNRDSFRVLTDLCCENLRRYLGGEPLLNMVRREFGY